MNIVKMLTAANWKEISADLDVIADSLEAATMQQMRETKIAARHRRINEAINSNNTELLKRLRIR